jgi:hypothetical protein
MGTLPLETETVTFDIYLSLGLKESDKENPEIPRVLWLLSSLLERSVQKNDMLLKNSQIKDVLTIFHGSRAPSLGIQQYLERIFKYSCCSPSCFVLAHIYLERFIQQKKVHLTSLNVHRLVITSVMVAAKFIDDSFFNNTYYARVGGVSTSELNRLEMKFLFGLDFRLYVSVQAFGKCCSQLEKEAALGIPIERPILACGIKESWSNTDDSSRASTTV